MMHLSYDELFELAEASGNGEGFEDIQIQQLEHLKECTECYESFCLLSALSDVMSESYVFSLDEAMESVAPAEVLKSKVLAKINLIRNSASNVMDAVMEQIDQASAALQFGPSLAMATRGAGQSEASAVRIEEFEDDKTYIVYKPESNELMIQINTRDMDDADLHVYLEFEDSERKEVPLSKRGKIVKGSMDNLPGGSFGIVIELEN